MRRVAAACGVALLCTALGGCGVILVAGTAASLAVDATVGVVKLTGKAVGAAVDVVTPGGDEKK
ncbi:hypothetical protein FN976_05700 [Caenimonas sedimenti]|uniref:Lipoprotein n=1 Tax=Caenimonas sedimenti TaxID=2596921 RepID=A0A562ZVW7_9BURK|nr:hypothetical protein FN976_05700 [Caenimonas sedimenti]